MSSPYSLFIVRSLAPFAAVAALTTTACKKTETQPEAAKTTEAAPAAAKPEAAKSAAAPAAAQPVAAAPSAAPAAGPTKLYTNPAPAFTIQLPADFIPNEPMQTGGNNTTIRFAKPDEHSGNGTFVSVTWWKKTPTSYKQLRSQVAPPKADRLEDKEIAGGKGVFFYGTKMSSRMVSGELKDAKMYRGTAAVEGGDFVLTCTVDSFDEPPPPAFVRACETLALP